MPISNKLDSLIKLIKKNLLMEAEQHVVYENYVASWIGIDDH